MRGYVKSVVPEGEKHWGGGPVVIGGNNLPSPVQIRLTMDVSIETSMG